MGGLGGGSLDVTWGARDGSGQEMGNFREIENGGAALDGQGGDVVGPGRHFGGGESTEPDPGLLSGLPDFGDPFPPCPHSHSSVHNILTSLLVFSSVVGPGTTFSTSLIWAGFRVRVMGLGRPGRWR